MGREGQEGRKRHAEMKAVRKEDFNTEKNVRGKENISEEDHEGN